MTVAAGDYERPATILCVLERAANPEKRVAQTTPREALEGVLYATPLHKEDGPITLRYSLTDLNASSTSLLADNDYARHGGSS